jgi:sRNA-binding carbon storage regulator CsrA
MIGDGERVTVVTIPEQELALVIGAPQFIGMHAQG